MNKRAEGTPTSLVQATVMILAVFVIISYFVVTVGSDYQKIEPSTKEITEFQRFEDIYNEFNESASTIIGTQDQPETNKSFLGFEITQIVDVIDNKAFRTIKELPKLMKTTTKMISAAMFTFPFEIPGPVKWTLITLISLTVIFLFIKTLWRYRYT